LLELTVVIHGLLLVLFFERVDDSSERGERFVDELGLVDAIDVVLAVKLLAARQVDEGKLRNERQPIHVHLRQEHIPLTVLTTASEASYSLLGAAAGGLLVPTAPSNYRSVRVGRTLLSFAVELHLEEGMAP